MRQGAACYLGVQRKQDPRDLRTIVPVSAVVAARLEPLRRHSGGGGGEVGVMADRAWLASSLLRARPTRQRGEGHAIDGQIHHDRGTVIPGRVGLGRVICPGAERESERCWTRDRGVAVGDMSPTHCQPPDNRMRDARPQSTHRTPSGEMHSLWHMYPKLRWTRVLFKTR